MPPSIPTLGIHHLTLTVTDLDRSEQFYTGLLGFQRVAELAPTRRLYSNGSLALALTLPWDPTQAPGRFNENHVGLDHLCLTLSTRAELDQAAALCAALQVPHGEIKDLGEGLGVCVMALRDPDNIQLELCAPR